MSKTGIRVLAGALFNRQRPVPPRRADTRLDAVLNHVRYLRPLILIDSSSSRSGMVFLLRGGVGRRDTVVGRSVPWFISSFAIVESTGVRVQVSQMLMVDWWRLTVNVMREHAIVLTFRNIRKSGNEVVLTPIV